MQTRTTSSNCCVSFHLDHLIWEIAIGLKSCLATGHHCRCRDMNSLMHRRQYDSTTQRKLQTSCGYVYESISPTYISYCSLRSHIYTPGKKTSSLNILVWYAKPTPSYIGQWQFSARGDNHLQFITCKGGTLISSNNYNLRHKL